MDRRQFVLSTAAVGTIGIAGCLGDNDDEIEGLEDEIEGLEDEIEGLEDEIEDLEDEIEGLEQTEDNLRDQIEGLENEIDELEQTEGELQDEITSLEDEINALEASEDDLEGEVEELETEREELVEAILLNRYETAFAYYELGNEEYNQALEYVDEEEWTSAAKFFGVAFRSYDTSQELTFQTGQLADREGYTQIEDLLTDANQRARALKNASDHYSVGSQYFATGRTDQGQDEFETGDAYIDDASSVPFESPTTFELNLQ